MECATLTESANSDAACGEETDGDGAPTDEVETDADDGRIESEEHDEKEREGDTEEIWTVPAGIFTRR